MLNFMGDMLAIPDPVVLRATYDAAFAANIAPVDSWLYDYFNTSFDVTFGEVEIIPGVFEEAAIWTLTMYISFNLFRGGDSWGCPRVCPLTTGVFALP